MKTFRDLKVWQEAHALVKGLYRATGGFPESEAYGLRSQVRRAAVSVPTNIVEGFKRDGRTDQVRFFNIAQASLEETKYLLLLSHELGFLAGEAHATLDSQAETVGKMLHGLKRGWKSRGQGR